jgi:hypothetical protein
MRFSIMAVQAVGLPEQIFENAIVRWIGKEKRNE